MGFMEVIKGISGLTHYYPLNDVFTVNDQQGSTKDDPSAAGTNFKHFVNQGGVTFSSTGATFNGGSTAWLRAPTSPDFSVRNSTNTNTTGAFSMFIALSFSTYTGYGQEHWMGKGYNLSNNLEWAMRIYGNSETSRCRGISNYYWNPNPSLDSNGGAVASNRGSGAYLAPTGGCRTPFNAPTAGSTVNVEKWLGIEFTYAGTDGQDGRCRMWYGDATTPTPMALSWNGSAARDRSMWADARVTPMYTAGDLSLGRRLDNAFTMSGKVRRVGFFNRTLTSSEWVSLGNAMSQVETSGGGGTPTNPGVDTLGETFATIDTARYDVTNSGQASVVSNVLRLVASTSGPILQTKSTIPFQTSTTGIYAGVLPAVGPANTATYFMLPNTADTTQQVGFQIITNSAGAQVLHAGSWASGAFTQEVTPVNYNATNHAFLRIAQSDSSNVGFYVSTRKPTSPSDNPWTLLGTIANPAYVSAVRIKFAQTAPTTQTTYAQFANVNGAAGTIVPPVVVTPPPTPGTAPFSDEFSGLDTDLWDDNVGTPTVSAGILTLDATSTAEVLSSTTLVNLTGQKIFTEITEVPTVSTSFGLFRLQADDNNALQWHFSAGKGQAQQIVNGVTTNVGGPVSFNAATTRFFSIRETSGKIYFEYGTSSTALTAVELAGRTTPLPYVTAMQVVLEAQTP